MSSSTLISKPMRAYPATEPNTAWCALEVVGLASDSFAPRHLQGGTGRT